MKSMNELAHDRNWRYRRTSRLEKLRGPLFILGLIAAILAIPTILSRFGYPVVQKLFPWVTSENRRLSSAPFSWDKIEASESLKFYPCYDGFECAKLKLPLDYFNGTHPKSTVSIALAKLPAKVPVDDPRYGGPILINPGGPGGSGVLLALLQAAAIQKVADAAKSPEAHRSLHKRDSEYSSSAKYFDVIGFDPRGIGYSEPGATCMPDNPSWWSWRLREATEGILGSSDAALGRLWSMNHAYGTSCEHDMDGPDIKQYMTTVSVARDMLEIVEKHAEYVARQVNQHTKNGFKSSQSKAITYVSNTAKLQYWGFSYGTYLGSTFASMFPNRVGRLILDGVVNTDDYNNALGEGSLYDAEKVMHSFYTYCLQAGPESCPLTAANATVEDIKDRVQAIIKSLLHHPLPLYSIHGPEVLTYTDIKSLMFASLYSPMLVFPIVSQILAAIEARNITYLNEYGRGLSAVHVYQCSISDNIQQPDVPQMAILCADGDNIGSEDIDTFEKYWRNLDTLSPTSGSIWSALRIRCISWKVRALHRYRGAFGANTSHPILWISNTADPVTPLKSARIMNKRFPGSRLLIQDSPGHCSLVQPTLCTYTHIRNYFQTGALPDQETFCVPPSSPFSLNSTNPDSPFYDPSLGKSSQHLEDDALYRNLQIQGLSAKEMKVQEDELMKAATHLQRWQAEGHDLWPLQHHGMERVRALLATGANLMASRQGGSIDVVKSGDSKGDDELKVR